MQSRLGMAMDTIFSVRPPECKKKRTSEYFFYIRMDGRTFEEVKEDMDTSDDYEEEMDI